MPHEGRCKCDTASEYADACCCAHLTQLQEGESAQELLWGLLANETQMTHLHLPWSGLPRDDLSTVYQQLGGLTALRNLGGMNVLEPKHGDCCALQRLQQLTMLVIPLQV